MANGSDGSDGLPDMPTVGVPLIGEPGASTTAAPPAPAAPTATAPRAGGNLNPLGNYWADYYGLDRNIFSGMIAHESGWDQSKRGAAGEIGLGQLMPETARGLGITNPNDPSENLRGAALYLRKMLDDPRVQGDYGKALMLYNSGPNPKVPFKNTAYAVDVLNRANAVSPDGTTVTDASVPYPYVSGSNVPGTNLAVGPQLAFVNPNALSPRPADAPPLIDDANRPNYEAGKRADNQGAGGPGGDPHAQTNTDAQQRQLIDQFLAKQQGAGQQGRGWQMLALMGAMLKGTPIFHSSYDPQQYVPRLDYARPVSTRPLADVSPVPSSPWEQYAYRPAPPVTVQPPSILPPRRQV